MSLFKSFSRTGTDKPSMAPGSPPTQSNLQSLPQTTQKVAPSIDTTPSKTDGSDKYYGMENFGNTCYCNSVVQALFYTRPFRDAVINYPRNNVSPPPPRPEPDTTTTSTNSTPTASINDSQSAALLSTTTTTTTTTAIPTSPSTPGKPLSKTKSNTFFPRTKLNRTNSSDPSGLEPSSPPTKSAGNFPNGTYGAVLAQSPTSPGAGQTNPYAPSPYSLNGAIASTSIIAQNAQKDPNAPPPMPSIPVDYSRSEEYGMKESLFTCLKDLFERIIGENGKSGIIAPTKLVEVLKRENEMFSGNTHQDAHEFLNYLLNDIVESVDKFEKSRQPSENSTLTSNAPHNARWVHELFEGILTSETKCLTCENLTTRDEVFLDLSIDIEQNSSVSACLRQFSASEMLCERNKFHCDVCGGLQEAEKRMKIQKSPKILALHLKRFKYTEDMQRNLKLFHRVVYPPTLRLFNTTDDAEDPDRMYELYAVVVHIGGGPYHGHYVTVVKNDDTGKWMLIDDEAVEAVDDGFVGRFYGDRPGMASAYVLFYQQVEQKPIEPVDLAIPNGIPLVLESAANGVVKGGSINGHSETSLTRVPSSPPVSRTSTRMPSLATVEEKPLNTSPPTSPVPANAPVTPIVVPPTLPAIAVTAPVPAPFPVAPSSPTTERTPTKKELKDAAKREKEERKEREKREKEEAKKDSSKKLGRGLGTIKRWGKDKS